MFSWLLRRMQLAYARTKDQRRHPSEERRSDAEWSGYSWFGYGHWGNHSWSGGGRDSSPDCGFDASGSSLDCGGDGGGE